MCLCSAHTQFMITYVSGNNTDKPAQQNSRSVPSYTSILCISEKAQASLLTDARSTKIVCAVSNVLIQK